MAALGVSRSQVYADRGGKPRGAYRKSEDGEMEAAIHAVMREKPSYGYRRVTGKLNEAREAAGQGRINAKRVHRVMKLKGWLLQRHTGRPIREHSGTIMMPDSDRRWCTDVFEIGCQDGQRLRVAFVLDCADREVIAWTATTGGVDGEMVRDLMTVAAERRFGLVDRVPEGLQWLSDNGSAYTARETRGFGESLGLALRTTPYRSPESNGMAEAFVKTFKRDYVSFHEVPDACSVMEQLPGWFEDYNEHAPHKALKYRSPRAHRRLLAARQQCPAK